MAYLAASSDDEELKKKNAGLALGGEAEAAAVPGQDAAAKAQPYTQTGFASAKNIFNKNQGAADQYDVTQPFNEDLGKAKDSTKESFGKLQATLGQQVQGAKASDADLAEAVAAGQGSAGWNKISQALAPQKLAGSLDPQDRAFKTANDVTSLNTAPGIQAAIANQAEKKGVQNYSQGMGSLDAAIYQRDAGYRNKVAGLSNQYAAADKERKDYEAQAASAVEKSNKELQDFSGQLRGKLSGQSEAIKLANDTTREGAANQRRIAQENAARNSAAEQKNAIIQQMANSIGDESVRARFLWNANNDQSLGLGNFYNQGQGSQYDYSNEDAGKFNNIMALLGGSEKATAGGSVGANFNKSAYENALRNKANEFDVAAKGAAETRAANEKIANDRAIAAQAAADAAQQAKTTPMGVLTSGNKSPSPKNSGLDVRIENAAKKEAKKRGISW